MKTKKHLMVLNIIAVGDVYQMPQIMYIFKDDCTNDGQLAALLLETKLLYKYLTEIM